MDDNRRRLLVYGATGLALSQIGWGTLLQRNYRIACLWQGSPAISGDLVKNFFDALSTYGYVEGKNIQSETRWAENHPEQFDDLAAQLVSTKPDVIVPSGSPEAVMAVKKATSSIPIVMIGTPDPVKEGLIESLSHPGGNVTGVCTLHFYIMSKRLELLHIIAPKISRVALLISQQRHYELLDWDELHKAMKMLGLTLIPVFTPMPHDFEAAFAAVVKARADAVAIVPDSNYTFHRKTLADLALKARLPIVCHSSGYAEAGALLSYGVNLQEQFKMSAGYIDKIFRGIKPADLPVQQPTEFELVLNLKTAKKLGIEVPREIFVRANRVIE